MSLQDLLLAQAAGQNVEFHSRVFSSTIHDAQCYFGWHWDRDSRSRWSFLIPSRLV
jgi:hypothetical protein